MLQSLDKFFHSKYSIGRVKKTFQKK